MRTTQLGRCPRCKGYALVDEADGVRLALDIAPLDPLGFGIAVVHGHRLWWVQNEPGRPPRLLGAHQAGQRPPWGPSGAQEGTQRLHAPHGCGAPARDIVIMNVQSPKGSAPATPGAAAAGNPRRAAPVAGAAAPASPSPAPTATRRRSDGYVNALCDVCRGMIGRYKPVIGVQIGDRWVWVMHDECP